MEQREKLLFVDWWDRLVSYAAYETPLKRPIYASWEWEEEKREKGEKIISRNGWKPPTSGEGNGQSDSTNLKELQLECT